MSEVLMASKGQQTTLRDAVADIRQLVTSEAGHLAYFDDELDAVVAAALRQGAGHVRAALQTILDRVDAGPGDDWLYDDRAAV